MNRLTIEKQTQVLAALVEGNSIRATVRLTGVAKNTIVKLLAEVGEACEAYHNRVVRNLACQRIQCDEIWSFCYAKDRNLPKDKQGKFGFGSVWTWTAIDADSKLMVSWRVGDRDAWAAQNFMHDLRARLSNRVQITTDGHRLYLSAVELAFGSQVDFAMMVKMFGGDARGVEARYSPPKYIGCQTVPVIGRPKTEHISTSFAERQNLTMRMQMRRFTRLTNAFSKKVDNLRHAVALHFMYYNFCRVHQSLRVTPAMEMGISSHVWDIAELVTLLTLEAKVA
jgi:IS1 family transposase